MNKKLVIALLFTLAFTACSKKGKNQYSTWNVNGENFSSNEVIATIGKVQSALSTNDFNNRFVLAFSIVGGLPTSGTFELNTITPGVQECGINFYVHGKFYYHTTSKLGKLFASEEKGKAKYTLPPSWFVSYENPTTDSVLISGEFKEP